MSEEPPNTHPSKPESENGVIRSYVIGFILSLVFTLIPYYLVVEKIVTGNLLLATILGFAILQLLVQVIFFLHLGREKNPKWQSGFLIATVGAIFVVTVGSVWIMSHLNHNMTHTDVANKVSEGEAVYQIDGEQVGTCPNESEVIHKIVFTNEKVRPLQLNAKLCDSIMFVNESGQARAIMFGTYDKMETYGGEASLSIRSGRNKIILLTEPGTHQFHDHQNPSMMGVFTVTQ
jgi:cytochrome o ubiquinol oxidase subunit IV